MDVVTDILDSMRLSGGVVVDGHTKGDWCLLSRFTDDDRAKMAPGATELVAYHYIRSGQVHARVEGNPVVTAGAGDIILLPRNDAHLFYSRADLPPIDSHEIMQESLDAGEPVRIVIDGPGEEASFYCGFLAVSTDSHPLLDSLPPILKLTSTDTARKEWLESSMKLMNAGTNSPEIVSRLAELFLAEAIRRYIEQHPAGEGGWLGGLKDPAVARALAVIHERFAEDIDIEMLAREAGVSRTVLGERFTEMIGEPPMRYCGRWRMRVAANMLRDGRQNASNVAYAVGFNSEAAFNRAFKREYGEPPAKWRKRVEELAQVARRNATDLPEQIVRYCTAKDGTRLAFSAVGDGPPLLKAANWLNHIEHDWKSPVWRHWLHELTVGHTLVRYDERANGLSDWDTKEISFEAFVDDMECVADCAGLEKFDVLAISQGASVAIAYAVRHPERVRRLVICGGYAQGWASRGDPEEIARREAMLTLTEIGWGNDHPAYRELFTNLYIPGGTEQQVSWWNDMQKVSCSAENAVKLQRALSEIDVRDLLAKVTVPTIIFHSKDDQVVPFSAGEYLAAHIPGSIFVPLEGDNHILLEKEPAWQQFVRLTRDFLGSDEPAPVAPAILKQRQDDDIRSCKAADGADLAYAVTGDGFPIVKAPNWMTHLHHDWTSPVYGHWYELAAEMGQLVRMDLRGFGMSDWDPPQFNFEALVGDMATVLDDAKVDQCDMVAVSHGCAFAIAYAARHPERVRKLILVNSFAAGWRVRSDPEEIAYRESLLEMNRQRPAFRRSLLGEMFITLYFPSASEDLIDWHNEHFSTLGPVRNMEPMIDLASKIDVRDELAKIGAETLVLHSNKDGNAPVDVGRKVAEGIQGARFIELDSANHVLLGDEPAWRTFAREARAFLKS